MHGFEGMGFGMGWWWIIGLIFILAIIWLLIRSTNQNNSQSSIESKSALDILNERYARGEIDQEEYELKKRDLGS
ncbi:MAG: SHOCT domain-containing protein [Bacteroidales bacterium]